MTANPRITRQHQQALQLLPLVTLYLTERCNSRCVSCDYWRHGRKDISLASVSRLLPSLKSLGTRVILISGGEPLIHPEWMEISELLKSHGLQLWLLTSGLSLTKNVLRAARLFDSITVSLDGTDRDTYAAIRGLDAFDNVCEGIRAAADAGVAPVIRVTVQRANYFQLPAFIDIARSTGARQVSFLPADVINTHAFGRTSDAAPDVALHPEDLPRLAQVLLDLKKSHAAAYASHFIAESPQKMQRILQHFRAVCGLGAFPPVHCNAPEFSSVLAADGQVNPCFFIRGPATARADDNLAAALNGVEMVALRDSIRAGERPECRTCVCSMWREPSRFSAPDFLAHEATECVA